MIDKAYIKQMRAAAKRDATEFNSDERNLALLRKDVICQSREIGSTLSEIWRVTMGYCAVCSVNSATVHGSTVALPKRQP